MVAREELASLEGSLEIASTDQRMLEHPPDIAVAGPDQAQFWYNPNLGISRPAVFDLLPKASFIEYMQQTLEHQRFVLPSRDPTQ